MRKGILGSALLAVALTFGSGLGTAHAFSAAPGLGIAHESLVVPAAMCGRSCAGGGRYIQGPPSVCREAGLRYCGSSRDRGPAAVVVPVPGVGIEVGRRPVERCRTVTVQRPDGSIRTTRECR
jgi:hypothetical protein